MLGKHHRPHRRMGGTARRRRGNRLRQLPAIGRRRSPAARPRDRRVGAWAAANNVELASTPTNSSWLNRVEAQFTALRYFALDGTDHRTHQEQGSMIRRYIIWRNRHADDRVLRRIVERANAA